MLIQFKRVRIEFNYLVSEELVVEPKVLEPYEPIGDNIPRKVAINRK